MRVRFNPEIDCNLQTFLSYPEITSVLVNSRSRTTILKNRQLSKGKGFKEVGLPWNSGTIL